MSNGMKGWAIVDEEGRLVLPANILHQHGLKPGTRLLVEENHNSLDLHPPASRLGRIYIEPTNRCNITCRACIRNIWETEMGQMRASTFDAIMEGIRATVPKPEVFFGGFGEPLAHPKIIHMVQKAKEAGCWVELITNGTLLTPTTSRNLIDAGLDLLWVSIDGAREQSYADLRLGAQLPLVLENLGKFKASRAYAWLPHPEIGIVFVIMKRNAADLPEMISLARHYGASRFLVTNLLPYSPELAGEVLYTRSLKSRTYLHSPWIPNLSLPKLDYNETTRLAFDTALKGSHSLTITRNDLSSANDSCPFIRRGSIAIGWDGSVSPCLPLLYSHTSYLRQRQRNTSRWVIGKLTERGLLEIWKDPEYVSFRERVQEFEFSPCTFCGGCDYSDNSADCVGNEFPACGGCLWAQGIIQCP